MLFVAATIATIVVAAGAQQPANAPAPAARAAGTSARGAIDAAAAALGGADKLRRLRNLTLIGYAQYAYQNGGGNISPLPGAPQKFIAANDYRRVYDVEHGRMVLVRPELRRVEGELRRQRIARIEAGRRAGMDVGRRHVRQGMDSPGRAAVGLDDLLLAEIRVDEDSLRRRGDAAKAQLAKEISPFR